MALLLLFVCAISSVIARSEECPNHEKGSRSVEPDVSGEEVDEAVSLIQVGAKRLQKSAGPPNSTKTQSTASLAQVEQNTSAVSATPPIQVPTVVSSRKGKALELLAYFQKSETRGSAVAIVILVAVVGIAALCLLGMVLQPDTSARERRPQAGRNFADATGSFRTMPRTYTGSYNQGGMPRPVSQTESMPPRASMPRISVPPSAKNSMTSLPRVKQAVPGSALSLTPAGSIMPKKEDVTLARQPDDGRPPELTGNAPRRPVPICPFLVLPHCETFLAVPINNLVGGANTVEVLGLSGSALLRVTIKDASAGRIIEVSMTGPQSPPLATIAEAPEHGPRAGMMEIRSEKGSTHYGWLRPSKNYFGNSCHVLQSGGDDIMTVVTDKANATCQLYAGHSGDLLAQASRSGDGEGIFNAEDLEIRVTPGMDAVLALLCVPAIALFGENAFTFPPSRLSA